MSAGTDGGGAAGTAAKPARIDTMVTTPSGLSFREMTIYLPDDVARALALHCKEHDRDVSNVIEEVVKVRLAPEPAPAKAQAAKHDVWEKWREAVALLRARLAF